MRFSVLIAVVAAAVSSPLVAAVPSIDFVWGSGVEPLTLELDAESPRIGGVVGGVTIEDIFVGPSVGTIGPYQLLATVVTGGGSGTDAQMAVNTSTGAFFGFLNVHAQGGPYVVSGSVAGGDLDIDSSRFVSFQVPEPAMMAGLALLPLTRRRR